MRRTRLSTLGLAIVIAASLTVAGAQAAPPEGKPGKGQARAAVVQGDDPIAGEWIVTMKEGASDRERRQVMALARGQGATELVDYPLTLNGFSARMSGRAIERVRANAAVEVIEANQRMELAATQTTPPWGLDRIDQRNRPTDSAFTYDETGAGVRAYVVDTGVRADHMEFGSRVLPGIDTGDNDTDASDCDGHGTHVAGTVGGTGVGVAKGVTIVPVKVFACTGEGDSNMLLAGIEWMAANHPAGTPGVANASITFKGHYVFLERAVEKSIAGGISWVIAAGNDNINACDQSLGSRVDRAIVVGATDQNDVRGSFSNWGPCVDIFAPGVNIRSAHFSGTNTYVAWQGTSMASPHVAGAVALYLQANPTATPARVKGVFVNQSTKDVLTSLGTGSPNRLLYTGFLN